jgi:CBS domain
MRCLSVPGFGAVMTTDRHILEDKGYQVWSLRPHDEVYDALKMMADKDVGSLVVLDGSKIVGIVAERRYAHNVFLKGRASPRTSRQHHGTQCRLRWVRPINRGMQGTHDHKASPPSAVIDEHGELLVSIDDCDRSSTTSTAVHDDFRLNGFCRPRAEPRVGGKDQP